MTAGGERPVVLVLIPAHGAAETVGRAVRSVVDQRGVLAHALVIDHGSKDPTADRAKAAGAHVIQIERQAGSRTSPSCPLNVGVAAARKICGDAHQPWVVRLDADDFLACDDALARALHASQAAPVTLGLLTFAELGVRRCAVYGPRPDLRTRRALVRGAAYALGHHATIVRLDVLERVGPRPFDEGLVYGEDLDLTLKLLLRSCEDEVVFVAHPLTVKTFGPATITATIRVRESWRDQRRILVRHRQPVGLLVHIAAHLALTSLGRAGRMAVDAMPQPVARYGGAVPADFAPIHARLAELDNPARCC